MVDLEALKAIYSRAGGEAGVRKILRDFYHRMSEDAMIGFFFTGKNTDEIADRQLHFLMRAMGAAPTYSGKAPAFAHLELPPILPGHFDRRLRILEETLWDHGLNVQDIRTWVEFENAFRGSIVKD